MDDILLQGSSPPQMYLHAQVATLLFMVLGWSLSWEKSVSFPNQQATHLGFVLDSVSMTAPALRMGLPVCSLCAGMRRTFSLCLMLSVFLAQWSLCVQGYFLCAALQCFPEVAPGSKSFCLEPWATNPFVFKGPLHLLPGGFLLLDLLPMLLFQLGNWTPLLSSGQILVWSMEEALVPLVTLFKGLGLLILA